MSDMTIQFRAAMLDDGLIGPDYIEHGKMQRFPGADKSASNKAGWCKMFEDGLGGVYGDYATGLSTNWQAKRDTPYNQAERDQFKRQIAESKAQAEIEQKARHDQAAIKADEIWQAATPAPDDFPYLVRKGIKASGARLYEGRLVIPMRDDSGKLWSVQYIDADGVKMFMFGGRVSGCYFSIGKLKNAAALAIAEGFATGATIHEATGYPVAVAFTAGNLEAVAKAMRGKFPELPVILCADDDVRTAGNPGLTKATSAALAVGGKLAVPDFGNDRPVGATDFNDLAQICGAEAVKQAVASAKAPAVAECQAEDENVPEGGSTRPEPLPALPDVLPFNYNYLPDGFREFVRDISERMQCPPDFAAVGTFVMMATIIGRSIGIRPMRHNDWTVICNLWAAVVGNSGVMKSPTLSASLAALKQLQAWAFEEFNNQVTDHAAHDEIAKLQKAVAKSEVKKKLSKDKAADVSALLKPDAGFEAPILKRYITNNASYEALGELLMENPNGLLVESDEIIGLLKQLDAGGQEVARSFYLTAADGDKPYTFDRIMRGKGLHIPALCLSVIGGIQPGVLAEYVRQATGGGAGADGLLQRFGLMVYPDISPDWREVDRYPDSVARDAVNTLVERLDNLNPDSISSFELGRRLVPTRYVLDRLGSSGWRRMCRARSVLSK